MQNAPAKMGLAAGLVMSLASGLISAYTIVLLVHLYEERKRRLVRLSLLHIITCMLCCPAHARVENPLPCPSDKAILPLFTKEMLQQHM